MTRRCTICQQEFDPARKETDPAAEMGAFLAQELYADVGELCPKCLANRGQLAMMYMREYN
jgi:hypothetical protein